MIHGTRALLRTWIEALLHMHDSPQRTAAAFAVGVFLPAIVAGRRPLHLRTHAVAPPESH